MIPAVRVALSEIAGLGLGVRGLGREIPLRDLRSEAERRGAGHIRQMVPAVQVALSEVAGLGLGFGLWDLGLRIGE